MVEENFTINLVSNASMDVFPLNTMARLWLDQTTLLPNKVELSGDWEVAMLEVSWPGKVKNITNASFTISRFDSANRPLRPEHNQTNPAGFCSTVDTLMTKLLKAIYEHGDYDNIPVPWKLDPVGEKLELSFTGQAPEGKFWIFFKSDDLSKTLGVTDAFCGTVESERQKGFAALGNLPVDLQRGRQTMFIYSDLVQNEKLGDSQAALLKVISLQQNVASTGATCYRMSDKMQWKRLNKSTFQAITVNLCDESGHLMPLSALVKPISHCLFDDAKKTSSFVYSQF